MRAQSLLLCALGVSAFTTGRAQCSPAVQTLINEHKFDEARLEPLAAIKKNASDDVALHCMGRIAAAMDKPGEAIDWLEKAVKANENNALHHLWLGNSLGEQAEHTNKLKLPFLAKRIKSEFERTVALDPTSIDGRHGLIQFYSQAPGVMGGDMTKAKEQAREIEKLSPMRGHLEMATLLENKDKDLAGAEREYTAALAAAADSSAAYSALGGFYRRQRRYTDAIAVYERLLKAKPDALAAHLNIAWNLTLSGQGFDRAEREIKDWLADPPKNGPQANVAFAHYLLGMIYERQGKTAGARTEYQASLALNPRNTEAKKALDALK